MENTGKVFFDDPTPQWYLAVGQGWVGPLSASDVYEKILSHEITWAHYVWRKGQSGWTRLCDTPTFQSAVPAAPLPDITAEIQKVGSGQKASPPPAPKKEVVEERNWFLYYNDSQFGPFSMSEINRFLQIGKIHGGVYAWREGMDNWVKLEQVPEFVKAVEAAQDLRKSRGHTGNTKTITTLSQVEHRGGPRRPLVAKILMANTEVVIAAVCRDISIGGLQVLTDKIPGAVGDRIKFNVSPSGDPKSAKLEPFVAEGVIVRILEDGRGFSFRFEKLAEKAKASIESYISSGV